MDMDNHYLKNLVSRMSVEQKVGALLTLGFSGTVVKPHIRAAIEKYHCGGLRLTPHARTFGSYVDPRSGKTVVALSGGAGLKKELPAPLATAREYAAVLAGLQRLARARPLGIPLHFSFDQEGGTSADSFFEGVRFFPKPMGIRATGDPYLAYTSALAVARQARAIGFNWIHSPVLDINTEPRNPEIYTRAYSDRAEEVVEYASAACMGLAHGKLIATGKHFPGRGDSPVDAHFETPVITVDKATMLERELLPYRQLIERELLPSIMIAHSIFPAFDGEHIATVSKPILTGLLRETLGYEGVITTDSMTMGALATRYGVPNACALAVEAGADLVLMKAENNLVGETFDAIMGFVKNGKIPEKELDAKVYRVLNAKYNVGLFTDFRREDPEKVMKSRGIVGLSKSIARRSVGILRGKNIPLGGTEKILVVEQINKCPNTLSWHSGIFYEQCLRHAPCAEYLETEYTFDESDKQRVEAAAEGFNVIIITNFYIRGKLSNTAFLDDFCAKCQKAGKKVIIVTNTPYPLSVPAAAQDVLITYATSPDNIEAAAKALFGAAHPEAFYPIAWREEA
ncbi:MAG: hypothetical protein LBR16_04100 [Treponema sp.]|jgi:beta-N-acetylhexosaminidase|nr:hypothetical protein [Treponema sp.]